MLGVTGPGDNTALSHKSDLAGHKLIRIILFLLENCQSRKVGTMTCTFMSTTEWEHPTSPPFQGVNTCFGASQCVCVFIYDIYIFSLFTINLTSVTKQMWKNLEQPKKNT